MFYAGSISPGGILPVKFINLQPGGKVVSGIKPAFHMLQWYREFVQKPMAF